MVKHKKAWQVSVLDERQQPEGVEKKRDEREERESHCDGCIRYGKLAGWDGEREKRKSSSFYKMLEIKQNASFFTRPVVYTLIASQTKAYMP